MQKYQQIIELLKVQIESKQLHAGDPLPSIRQLSEQLKVSKNTVIKAYISLEDQGLIEPRARSGFFVCYRSHSINFSEISPRSINLGYLPLQIVHAAADTSQVPMGSANPEGRFPSRSRFYRLLARQAQKTANSPERRSHYMATPGNPELRRQLARRYGEWLSDTSADDIVITNGAQEAISLALRAVAEPGDTIVVESPSYYGTLQCIEALGMKVLEIPSHPEQGMNLTLLEKLLDTWPVKAILSNPSFNNPLGFIMPESAKQQLLVLAERYDLPIIEDDVFAELQHHGQRPLPIKYFDKTGRVILCSSLSKTLDTGIRLGWCLPGRYYEKINYLKYVTTVASASIIQQAVATFLSDRQYERHLRLVRRTYRQRKEQFLQQLYRYWPSDINVTTGQGGYLSWIELPDSINGDLIYKEALKIGIGITPGSLFSTSDLFQNCLRLNYSSYEKEGDHAKAIMQLGELVTAQQLVNQKVAWFCGFRYRG